eukprot:XP_001704744.1 Hypothetical protein GL50803_92897 [Giardia lamblia ATCC 50803]
MIGSDIIRATTNRAGTKNIKSRGRKQETRYLILHAHRVTAEIFVYILTVNRTLLYTNTQPTIKYAVKEIKNSKKMIASKIIDPP